VPPFGPLDYFIESRNLVIDDEETSRFTFPDNNHPIARVKVFSKYEEAFPLDYGVATFLETRIPKEIINFDDIIAGKSMLDYAQVHFNDEAWQLGINKYFPERADISRFVDCHEWKRSVEFVQRIFDPFMRGSSLTDPETIVNDFTASASSGFPLRIIHPKKGDAIKDPDVLDYFLYCWTRSGEMNWPQTYFTASLKDELRPQEKVKLNKTRLFAAGSIEHGYVTSRLFYDQRQRLKRSLFHTPSCIGIRQTRLDFDRLFRAWREHEFVGALDADNWDGSIVAYLLLQIAILRFGWLKRSAQTQENWNRILNVYRDAIYSVMLMPDGFLRRTTGGMPSGFGLTADDNTFVHVFLFCFSFLINGGMKLSNPYETFVEHVTCSMYGDDNTYSYDSCVSPLCSPDKVIYGCSLLNVKFSDSHATWDSVTFLGHNIVSQRIEDVEYFVGRREFNAILCGWILATVKSWEESVERSCSFRIMAYLHPTLFDLIDEYVLETLNNNDPNHLKPHLWAGVLPIPALKRMYFSRE
jgi:hypothetical protein